MSEALPQPLAEALEQSDRGAYVEQRIFILSPVGTFGTSAAIFVLLIGSYALFALAMRDPLYLATAAGIAIPNGTRAALILSLLVATVLGVQRYARVADRADIASLPPILRHGVTSARHFAMLTPATARLKTAAAAGVLLGIGTSIFLVPHDAVEEPWFAVVTIILSMLFVRGVELTRASTDSTRRFVDDELIVDLLRIDQLSVIGRSASRAALVWFSISAVSCLFFVEGSLTIYTAVLLAACASMGVFIFVNTMGLAHRKILSVKKAELNRIRREIDVVCRTAHADADAAQKLQGLLAYETRIAAVHEWPFDQTTLMRVAASALILTAPLAGRMLASFAVDRLGILMQ